jgi:hypothetical protein
VLTSLGVAPSLGTFSRFEVLMNAAIGAAVSLLARWRSRGWAGAPSRRTASWLAVLIETIQGVLLPARWRPSATWSRTRPGMLLGAVLFLTIRPMLRHG